MAIIKVVGYRCERCEHEWTPRIFGSGTPAICPECKSKLWNVKKQRE